MIAALEALQRGWRVLLLVAIPLMLGVGAYAEGLPDEFTSTAVVSFAPRTGEGVGADVVRIVLPKYQVFAESDGPVPRAARALGVPEAEIERQLTVSIPTDTSNVEITMTGKDAVLARKAANAIARDVVDFAENDSLLEAELVATARPNDSPSGPPRRLIEIAGAMAAVLVGVGAMLLRDRLRPIVRTANDVASGSGLRLLGAVPVSSALSVSPQQALVDPVVGSAVRNLRTQLDRALRRDTDEWARGRTLAVTSSVEGEGKTAVATLVALASARLEQRVLLIDGDLPRPNVGLTLGMNPSIGLAHALRSGTADFSPYVQVDVAPNLSVIPTSTDREAGDLAARGLGHLFEWATETYDVVVVDSPPLFGNDIGPTIATIADAVMLVVRRGTNLRTVEESVAMLRSLEAEIVGVVANGTPTPEQSYYA